MVVETPKSLTIEEAVAKMINLDSSDTGWPLEVFLDAVVEDAAEAVYIAEAEHCSESQIDLLKSRLQSCTAHFNLANAITSSLFQEVANIGDGQGSILQLADDSSAITKLTAESVRTWALEIFKISISIDTPYHVVPHNSQLTYRTKQLDALDDAIAEFYEKPMTSEKGEHIAAWIHDKYPFVSEKTAKEMCRIMRPDR